MFLINNMTSVAPRSLTRSSRLLLVPPFRALVFVAPRDFVPPATEHIPRCSPVSTSGGRRPRHAPGQPYVADASAVRFSPVVSIRGGSRVSPAHLPLSRIFAVNSQEPTRR